MIVIIIVIVVVVLVIVGIVFIGSEESSDEHLKFSHLQTQIGTDQSETTSANHVTEENIENQWQTIDKSDHWSFESQGNQFQVAFTQQNPDAEDDGSSLILMWKHHLWSMDETLAEDGLDYPYLRLWFELERLQKRAVISESFKKTDLDDIQFKISYGRLEILSTISLPCRRQQLQHLVKIVTRLGTGWQIPNNRMQAQKWLLDRVTKANMIEDIETILLEQTIQTNDHFIEQFNVSIQNSEMPDLTALRMYELAPHLLSPKWRETAFGQLASLRQQQSLKLQKTLVEHPGKTSTQALILRELREGNLHQSWIVHPQFMQEVFKQLSQPETAQSIKIEPRHCADLIARVLATEGFLTYLANNNALRPDWPLLYMMVEGHHTIATSRAFELVGVLAKHFANNFEAIKLIGPLLLHRHFVDQPTLFNLFKDVIELAETNYYKMQWVMILPSIQNHFLSEIGRESQQQYFELVLWLMDQDLYTEDLLQSLLHLASRPETASMVFSFRGSTVASLKPFFDRVYHKNPSTQHAWNLALMELIEQDQSLFARHMSAAHMVVRQILDTKKDLDLYIPRIIELPPKSLPTERLSELVRWMSQQPTHTIDTFLLKHQELLIQTLEADIAVAFDLQNLIAMWLSQQGNPEMLPRLKKIIATSKHITNRAGAEAVLKNLTSKYTNMGGGLSVIADAQGGLSMTSGDAQGGLTMNDPKKPGSNHSQ